jgi:hypothetical protein
LGRTQCESQKGSRLFIFQNVLGHQNGTPAGVLGIRAPGLKTVPLPCVASSIGRVGQFPLAHARQQRGRSLTSRAIRSRWRRENRLGVRDNAVVGLTTCSSQEEVLASIPATTSNVHWRTLISAVLILVLLPISSLAAVCDVNCRTNGMRSMAMNLRSPHTGQNARPVVQHHHEITPDSDPNVVSIAAVSHQVLASHACCNGLERTQISPCVRSENNTLQEQTLVSRCGRNSGIVRNHVSDLFVFKENLSRDSIPLASVPPAFFHSLTLRI